MRMGVALAAVLCAAGAAAGRPTYTATGPVAIPDAGPGNCATSPPGAPGTIDINVVDNLSISKVTVGVHIMHTWQADLKFTLEKVGSGTSVTLVDRAGSPPINPTCGFSVADFGAASTALFRLDDAAPFVYDTPNVPAPGIPQVTGNYKPESPLSAFNGMSSAGTWRLTAIDNAELDFGTIMFVSLTIEGGSPCYPDCNNSGTLTIADFGCFQAAFAGNQPYADCNQSGTFTIADFSCFQAAFANGCP